MKKIVYVLFQTDIWQSKNSRVFCGVFENIEIEVVGKWIWISGDTKAIKETLKNLGFKWASKKMMWYYGELLKCSSRKEKSIEEIRATYGTQKVQTKKSERIAA